jgi:HAE1 family hydrophobic/amphiphilic exporter-1
MSRVNGVAQVNIIGGQEREIQVSLDAIKMQGYGLSIPQVQQVFYHLTWTFLLATFKRARKKS